MPAQMPPHACSEWKGCRRGSFAGLGANAGASAAFFDAQSAPWDSSEAASHLLPETLDSSGLFGFLVLTFSA